MQTIVHHVPPVQWSCMCAWWRVPPSGDKWQIRLKQITSCGRICWKAEQALNKALHSSLCRSTGPQSHPTLHRPNLHCLASMNFRYQTSCTPQGWLRYCTATPPAARSCAACSIPRRGRRRAKADCPPCPAPPTSCTAAGAGAWNWELQGDACMAARRSGGGASSLP